MTDAPTTLPGRLRIGAVVRLTGLSSHVIRVWERRYAAVVPHRTPGGTRLYDRGHVDRLLQLAALTHQGHAIGAIAGYTDEALAQLTAQQAAGAQATTTGAVMTAQSLVPDAPDGRQLTLSSAESETIDAFLAALENLDLDECATLLEHARNRMSILDFSERVIQPTLVAVGDAWEAGALDVAHEHAAATLIRYILGDIARSATNRRAVHAAIVTTPQGEMHEFGALMASLSVTAAGWRAIYLGPNSPASAIARAAVATQAHVVLLSCVLRGNPRVRETLDQLKTLLGQTVHIVVGGRASDELHDIAGVTFVGSLAEVEATLLTRDVAQLAPSNILGQGAL
ncbi:MAG: MerR family transcriptional regulator [Myxococcales bacterium]|nr:MerR family transcriptional regulator [Myxococcales bacterium]